MIKRHQKNISYGIIAFRIIEGTPEFCMVCRKDSFSLSEFLRGKYELEDVEAVYRMFRYMTSHEYKMILSMEFEPLWDNLWLIDKKKIYNGKFKKEFQQSKYKFDTLKKGYYTMVHSDLGVKNKKFIKLENIINDIKNSGCEIFNEPEWGFPKGKKNENETDFDCAKREFYEETNVLSDNLKFINQTPIEERFVADNLQEYVHIYYLAECPANLELRVDPKNEHQILEVSNIKWFCYDEAIQNLRDYNQEKKKLLKQVNEFIIGINLKK
jgi:8-oxo-dGTP pyrophosphatase MutT (NUDIX family)